MSNRSTNDLLITIWSSCGTWALKEQWLINLREFRKNDLAESEWVLLYQIINSFKEREYREKYYVVQK